MEEKNLHPRIKRFYEGCLSGREQPKSDSASDLVESKHDRRAAGLRAVARELRKIGYIVMENGRGDGLVVIERKNPLQGTDPPG